MDRKRFLDNYEYLLRLKGWADRRLKVLGYEERNVKGVGIPELDGRKALDALFSSSSDYQMADDEELRSLINEINSRQGREIVFLGSLGYRFRLSVAEEICLFLAALPEFEGVYGKIFSWLNGSGKKTRPVMEVGARIMGLNQLVRNSIREELTENSPFARYMLDESWGKEQESFWDREVILDQRIAGYILGNQYPDERLGQISITIEPEGDRETKEESKAFSALMQACSLCGIGENKDCSQVRANTDNRKAVFLWGENGCGKKELLRQLSANEKKRIIVLETDKITGSKEKIQSDVRRAVREAILTDSFLAAEHYESLEKDMAEIFWEEIKFCPDPIFILSQDKPGKRQRGAIELLPVHIENPSFEERKQIWDHYMEKYQISTEERDRLAAKFLFLPSQIKAAANHYKNSCRILEGEEPSLYESCFAQIDHQLYERATKINSGYTWDQLILPDSQKQLLSHICSQMENKYTVYEEWGFGRTVAYGRGVTVVFAGPPGTGKTMAAQILSKELKLELYKIDLSQMVSKYVGETEKNLAAVFKEAEISNAILFFDEADSLFGRRTEVKSSNDRYANLETSYLLQRLEEYEGMTILATNYLKNIDEAFMRRMKYIIQFQFPDAAARKQIWKVTIPKKAPVSQDMDYDFLGDNLELAGGSIKNIAVYAAFMAADKKCQIGMKEILKAAQYEMQKTGKILLGKDLKQYGYLLEED